MRILVVKSSSLGDIIHTLPAITDAQQQIPSLRCHWVVEEPFCEIPTWHPTTDRVIPIALRRWRRELHRRQTYREWSQFSQLLRSSTFDAIIDAQGLIKSSFCITRLANGPKHGYDQASIREFLASWFYDHRYTVPRNQHAIERIRQLFAFSLGYTQPISTGNYGISHFFQVTQAKPLTPYLLFITISSRPQKLWPNEYWRQLIALMSKSGFLIKFPWGTEEERQRVRQLADQSPHTEVLPKCSLYQLGCLIKQAKAVVSLDTGLAHLTAALEVPNIALYGPTDPQLAGVYGKKQQIFWAEKSRKMSEIQPQQVFERLMSVLTDTHNH